MELAEMPQQIMSRSRTELLQNKVTKSRKENPIPIYVHFKLIHPIEDPSFENYVPISKYSWKSASWSAFFKL